MATLGQNPDADGGATHSSKKAKAEQFAVSFPVVGVGASAGGLEAFSQLLKALPPEPGLAFVLIPHLDPKHESSMSELLSRTTEMPVLQVHDGVRLKNNHVYIIPPDRDMTIGDGTLRLVSRENPHGVHIADRHIFPIAGDGNAQQSHWCHPVRHSFRRHPWCCRNQE